MESNDDWTRRRFIERTGSCAAHFGLMAAASPLFSQRLWASQERFPVVASEPWGRLERVAEGIWALVSTPMEDRTTLCNGGIIAGRSGVAVIESFASDEGARWMAGQALQLTGKMPTHVILTHYHGDHSGGLRGAADAGGPEIVSTPVTRDLIEQRNSEPPVDVLVEARLLAGQRSWEFDLGGRSVHVVPRRGHTDSDLSVQVYDPDVVFCGDLVWNGMFPNYVDATPSRLSGAVQRLRAMNAETYVPGHGALADLQEMDRYIDLLDDVEEPKPSQSTASLSSRGIGVSITSMYFC